MPVGVGQRAGLLACALLGALAVALIFTVLRPTMSAEVQDDAVLASANQSGAGFRAYLWFALATGLYGAVLGALATVRQRLSVRRMWWAIACSAIGTWLCWWCADTLAIHRMRTTAQQASEGVQQITVFPLIEPSVVLLVGAWATAVVYFIVLFIRFDLPGQPAG